MKYHLQNRAVGSLISVGVVMLANLGGCAAPMNSRITESSHVMLALGMVGSDALTLQDACMPMVVAADEPAHDGVFFLGAGDAIGQAVFTQYVAIVRARTEWQFAGGSRVN